MRNSSMTVIPEGEVSIRQTYQYTVAYPSLPPWKECSLVHNLPEARSGDVQPTKQEKQVLVDAPLLSEWSCLVVRRHRNNPAQLYITAVAHFLSIHVSLRQAIKPPTWVGLLREVGTSQGQFCQRGNRLLLAIKDWIDVPDRAFDRR